MSVRLRNGKWVVDIYPQGRKGKRLQFNLPDTIQTKEQAQKIEQEIKRQSKNPALPATPLEPTLLQIETEIINYITANRAEETLKMYKKALKNLKPQFGEIRLDSITEYREMSRRREGGGWVRSSGESG